MISSLLIYVTRWKGISGKNFQKFLEQLSFPRIMLVCASKGDVKLLSRKTQESFTKYELLISGPALCTDKRTDVCHDLYCEYGRMIARGHAPCAAETLSARIRDATSDHQCSI